MNKFLRKCNLRNLSANRDAGEYTPADIRFTQKENAIFAILPGWPGENREVQLQSFARDSLPQPLSISKVTMLGSEENIKWDLNEQQLVIHTPSTAPDEKAIVFKVVTN